MTCPPKDLVFPRKQSARSATSQCVGKTSKNITRLSSSVSIISELCPRSRDQLPAQAPDQCPHHPSNPLQSHQPARSESNRAGKSSKESETRGEKESEPSSKDAPQSITANFQKNPE